MMWDVSKLRRRSAAAYRRPAHRPLFHSALKAAGPALLAGECFLLLLVLFVVLLLMLLLLAA